jgi:hypothetical protein
MQTLDQGRSHDTELGTEIYSGLYVDQVYYNY